MMWQDVLGHDGVVEQFRRVMAGGRMASTFLFLGPEGVGKRLFALRLAKTLLCEAGADLLPCNRCESCRMMDGGTHPDLDVVGLPPGKRSLSVDQFLGDRDHRNQEGLCHRISLKPMMGQRRVAIIDDADHLNIESANCLLKTLEEPPPGSVIILIGTSRSRQLPTILSRAQVIRFQALSPAVVEQILASGIQAGDAEGAATLGETHVGGLKGLEEAASPGVEEFRQRFAKMMARPGFDGTALAVQIQDFLQSAGKESEAKRQYLRLAIDMVTEHFRNKLRNANSPDGGPALSIVAQNRVLDALDRCIQAEAELDRNANQATLLECWVDDLCGVFSGQGAVSSRQGAVGGSKGQSPTTAPCLLPTAYCFYPTPVFSLAKLSYTLYTQGSGAAIGFTLAAVRPRVSWMAGSLDLALDCIGFDRAVSSTGVWK